MSVESKETVADIMSEMRECADRMERHLLYDLRECATDYLRVLSDRIEAASKRECEATREYSSQVGNAAAMREALEKVRFYMHRFLQYMRLHLEDAEAGGCYERILEVVNAALSAPPRNCDVGTAEEQAKRFKSFCKTHLSGTRNICSAQCPCVGCRSMSHCLTKWAQMPYEEGCAK